MRSYKVKRTSHWARNRAAWDKLTNDDPFQDWDVPDPLPERLVEGIELHGALACLYADDRAHGDAFCERAIAVAERIIAEDRCRSNPVAEAGYPRNLGAVMRGRAYSRWLLGEPLDRPEMRRMAEYIATWCLTKALDRRRFHDSRTMNIYLEGVRAAMVACDLDYAAELLKTKHEFRWHHAVERDLWTRLIAAYPEVDEPLRMEFETFFDRVRDPDFEDLPGGHPPPTFVNREILALETGIIRQMYLVNASALEPVSAEAVIEPVAY
jgi:hypothetical protein